jgi:hypothetical protein
MSNLEYEVKRDDASAITGGFARRGPYTSIRMSGTACGSAVWLFHLWREQNSSVKSGLSV